MAIGSRLEFGNVPNGTFLSASSPFPQREGRGSTFGVAAKIEHEQLVNQWVSMSLSLGNHALHLALKPLFILSVGIKLRVLAFALSKVIFHLKIGSYSYRGLLDLPSHQ